MHDACHPNNRGKIIYTLQRLDIKTFFLKYPLFFILFYLATGIVPVFSQYGTTQGLVLLTGEILQEDGITPLPDVHIYNQNNTNVTVSDPTGFFSMYVSKIHVLRFSSVGYDAFFYSIPGDFDGDVYYIHIEMKQSTIALRPITVYGTEEKTESMLTREVLKPMPGVQFGTLVGEARPVEPNLGNPVSLLWDWFSKEGKEKRKLKELLKQDALRHKVDMRFESDLIWQLTGLYGEELEKFKRYCNLSQNLVLHANEYDFLLTVKTCYYKYKNQGNRR